MTSRINNLRVLDENNLQKRFEEIQKELLIETTQVKAGGRAPNPGKLKSLKKLIAIVKTLMNEKKLNIKREIKTPVIKEKTEVKSKKPEEKKEIKKSEVDEKNA
ncbi:MAG: 50S ribosomal protein L29 [Candidatus Micrarchaeia archaeon]|jgi:ribosomal protein L29